MYIPILGAHKAKTEVCQQGKLTYPQNFPLLDDCSELFIFSTLLYRGKLDFSLQLFELDNVWIGFDVL